MTQLDPRRGELSPGFLVCLLTAPPCSLNSCVIDDILNLSRGSAGRWAADLSYEPAGYDAALHYDKLACIWDTANALRELLHDLDINTVLAVDERTIEADRKGLNLGRLIQQGNINAVLVLLEDGRFRRDLVAMQREVRREARRKKRSSA
jgi:hypothetical protein